MKAFLKKIVFLLAFLSLGFGFFKLSQKANLKFGLKITHAGKGSYSQTKTISCEDYGGCKNGVTFECKENECKPISDGKLKITIKGDYNMSYPQRESLQMDVENGYLRDIFGGGERGVEDECQKEFTFEYQIPKEDLEKLLQDGKFEIEFFDTNFVDCCCKAERKAKLEFEYETPQVTITVSKTGDGSGTVTSNPAGIDCGNICSASFDPGSTITLTATPSSGSAFGGWSGACSGMNPNCTLTLGNTDQEVIANFVEKKECSYPCKASCILPQKWDWRDVDGKNWLNAIRNQKPCGTCWAFSAVGSVEGTYNVEQNCPACEVDLSEQQLVSKGNGCCNLSYCGNCMSGGLPQDALEFIKSAGIVEESCFPYKGADLPCNLCANATKRVHIEEYLRISSNPDHIKRALICNGPLSVASFNWRHAIVLVGYDDQKNHWIIRNSWGPTWEDKGYGYIPYSGHPYSDLVNYVFAVRGTNAISTW